MGSVRSVGRAFKGQFDLVEYVVITRRVLFKHDPSANAPHPPLGTNDQPTGYCGHGKRRRGGMTPEKSGAVGTASRLQLPVSKRGSA